MAESQKLESAKTALQIDKHLNTLKLNELLKRNKSNLKATDKAIVASEQIKLEMNKEDIITIDSDDD